MQSVDRAGRAWRTLRENFSPFLEAAPDAIIIVDQLGKIVLANPQTRSLFGYSEDELVGQPIEGHPDIANIPVLMVTSSDKPSRQTRERLSAAGAVGLLVRPVDAAVLLKTIEDHLPRGKP